MKLIHISDIHLTEKGHEIWGVSTLEHFSRAIQDITRMNDIDAIVVSGDLSDDGSRWAYEYIDNAFAEIGIPTYCCAGNHDNLNEFYQSYKPSYYNICETFDLCDWTFIMLNSAVEGMSRGLCNLDKLERLLHSHKNKALAVVLHHPPIVQEGWLNRKLLENRNDFNKIIRQAKNVKMVLYGHTHYGSTSMIDGIVYSSAPSVGFAFHPNLPKFTIANGQEGFNIITVNNEKIAIVVHKIQ